MSGDTAVLLAALASLLTAGMNVYTYLVTNKQTEKLIDTVSDQAKRADTANSRLSSALKTSQEMVDKIVDRVLPEHTGQVQD